MNVKKVSTSYFSRISNLYHILTNPLNFFKKNQQQFGTIFEVPYLMGNITYLLDPDAIQHVLEKKHLNYPKSSLYDPLKLALGNGLLTSDGDFWKEQRKKLQPAFHTNAIASFCKDISIETDLKLAQIGQRTIDLNQELADLTINIACRSFFDLTENSFSDFIFKTTKKLNTFTYKRTLFPFIPLWLPLPSHLAFKRSIKQVNETIKKLIASAANDNKRPSLLSMLVQAKSMSDKQIRDEVLTFLIAGHETTTNALSFLIYLLSKYDVIRENVKSEINSIITEEHPSFESLQKLVYTKAVINEALRLFPPAWIISRECLKDDTIGNFFISENTLLVIPTFIIQRNAELWDKPNDFNPERFLNKDQRKFTFLPFGGGPRFCIGMQFAYTEILIVLCKLFRYGDFKVLNTSVTPEFAITLRPKQRLYFKFL